MGNTIDTDNLLNFRNCSALVGLTEDGLRYYLSGKGEPVFPKSVMQLDDRKYYERKDVLEWNKKRKAKRANGHKK